MQISKLFNSSYPHLMSIVVEGYGWERLCWRELRGDIAAGSFWRRGTEKSVQKKAWKRLCWRERESCGEIHQQEATIEVES